MEDDEKKSWTSYFTKKVIVSLSAIATLLSVVGGIWGFEAHYVDTSEMKNFEMKIVTTIENQQYKSDVKFYQFMYDKLTTDLFELKRQMRRYPEDELLKEDYKEILNQRNKIKDKLDKSMEKIN